LFAFLGAIEFAEFRLALFIDDHDGSNIAAAIAVVGGTPDVNEAVLREHVLVALHDQLVCACNKFDVVDLVEVSGGLPAELLPSPTGTLGPGFHVRVLRVTPHDVAEGAGLGDLYFAVEDAHLVDGAQLRAESAVQAECASVDQCPQVHEVEEVRALLPHVAVALLVHDFDLEPLHDRYLTALVVAAQEGDLPRVFEFVAEQQSQGLD